MRYTYKYLEDSCAEHQKYLEDSWLEGCKYLEDSWSDGLFNDDVPYPNININTNITVDMALDIIVECSHKKWDWGGILGNTTEKDKKDKENWINNHRLQIIKALQIQRHWRNCVSNPVYKLAQKLIKERLDN